MPKLSIITVNLNNAKGLQKTIKSVISQTFTDYEYIVIDGGSTDDSEKIIKKYADKITYWVSEPDKGIYNAMNKGISKTKGEYLQFLNSGDLLIAETALDEVFFEFPDKDIVYGNLKTTKEITVYPDKLTYSFFFAGTLGHPSSFIKKELFEKYGNYNEQNKIVSDWEFFISAIIFNNCSYQNIKKTISFYEGGGLSSDKSMYLQEKKKMLKNKFPVMYEEYNELQSLKEDILFYQSSRLIQLIKKIQQNKFYRVLRKKNK